MDGVSTPTTGEAPRSLPPKLPGSRPFTDTETPASPAIGSDVATSSVATESLTVGRSPVGAMNPADRPVHRPEIESATLPGVRPGAAIPLDAPQLPLSIDQRVEREAQDRAT